MSFDYKISKGITTRKFEKRICFKPENVKGYGSKKSSGHTLTAMISKVTRLSLGI